MSRSPPFQLLSLVPLPIFVVGTNRAERQGKRDHTDPNPIGPTCWTYAQRARSALRSRPAEERRQTSTANSGAPCRRTRWGALEIACIFVLAELAWSDLNPRSTS